MGTTLGAIQAGGGLQYQVVVAVEGYEYLLTNGPTAAAVTAWTGTDWTQALGGLGVRWPGRQELQAWKADVQVTSLSFCVQGDANDTFGRAVFGSAAGAYTAQTAPVDNNDTTLSVASTAGFASSGAVHLGTERIAYTSKTTQTLTGLTRGTYAPFRTGVSGDSRFGRYHPLGLIGDGIVINPHVSSSQRKWKGRWVGVWIHRVVGGVLDVKSEAQLVFAGRISSVRDEADGLTWVECDDVRGAIRDCTLLSDQWTARLREGIYLKAGWRFAAQDRIWTISGTVDVERFANDLVVVDASPGANEILAGVYTLDELATELNAWLQAERSAARLSLYHNWTPRVAVDAGIRSQWSANSLASFDRADWYLYAPSDVLEFMGWPAGRTYIADLFDAPSQTLTSPNAPYRVFLTQSEITSLGTAPVPFDEVQGSWWSQRDYLPAKLKTATLAGQDWGVVQVNGGAMALARLRSDTQTITLKAHPLLDDISGQPFARGGGVGQRVTVEDDANVELRQVAVIHGELDELLTRFLVSTGTAAYNSASDVFPAHLGAAIPYELLGTAWTASVANVAESAAEVDIVIEKPTRLTEVIGADLAARLAFFRWKNGSLRLATWSTPSTATVEHAFTEDNKATPSDATDNQRTVANETDDFLCNQLKLEYNRVLAGGYRSTTVIRDQGSMYEHGSREPVTISLRNTFSGLTTNGGAIDHLTDQLAAQLRLFSQPLRLLRRTIALPYYEGLAPGDVCSVTDRFARDPATGARGLTNRAGLVVGVQVDWGGYELDSGGVRQPVAQVDVLIFPRDKISAYCPAASFLGSAYTSGTKTIAAEAHAYSETTDPVDASWFAAGDAVIIVEADPDDPAAPQLWVDTVSSVSSSNIVLSTGLAGVTSSKRYRILSDAYPSAVTTQRVDAYQARAGDLLVASGVDAYEYGLHQLDTSVTEVAGAAQPSLYARAAIGQGKALDVAYEWDAAHLANNVVHHRTKVVAPTLYRNVLGATVACVRRILAIEPIVLHPGELLGSMEKQLMLRPWLRSTSGTAKLYATLCREPPSGDALLWTDADARTYQLRGAGATVEWSSSSSTWALGTVQGVDISTVDPATGIGYLVIEGERYLETRGMALCQVNLPLAL